MKKDTHTPKCPDAATLDYIRRRFRVDERGVLLTDTYRGGNKRKGLWRVAGTPHSQGYYQCRIRNRQILNHHIVFFLVHGRWPELPLDHIDDDRRNNHPDNLRELPIAFNNNKAHRGRKTVKYDDEEKGWYVPVNIDRKDYRVGYYDTETDAMVAYVATMKKIKEMLK